MSYEVNLDAKTSRKLRLELFIHVKNTADLRQKVMDGTLKCCLMKPSLIRDCFIVAIAANGACLAEKLVTKTLFTEVLYNLSQSTNINETLQSFGVTDGDTDVLVATVDKIGEEDDAAFDEVDGVKANIDQLLNFNDLKAIRKSYKLSDVEMKGDLFGIICDRVVLKCLRQTS